MRYFRLLPLLLLSILCSARVAQAEAVGTPALSQILLQANNIVEVETVALNRAGGEFKIVQVFGDSEFKANQVIQINLFGTNDPQVQYGLRNEDRETLQQSTRIVFFLRRVFSGVIDQDGPTRFYNTQPLWYWNDNDSTERDLQARTKGNVQMVWGGIRLLTKDGQVLRPSLEGSWNGPTLQPIENATWDQLLKTVEENTSALTELKAFKNIADRTQRGAAMLEWIKGHHELLIDAEWAEFAEPTVNQRQSWWSRPRYREWNMLALRAFGWVMRSGDVETCWQAIQLYKEVPPHPSTGTPDKPSGRKVFGSVAGRKLLLDIATDDKQSVADRNLALYYLLFNYWNDWEAKGYEFSAPDAAEHAVLMDRLLPLLQSNDASIRMWAANNLRRVSYPEQHPNLQRTRNALPALTEALKKETNEETRKMLTFAIKEIED